MRDSQYPNQLDMLGKLPGTFTSFSCCSESKCTHTYPLDTTHAETFFFFTEQICYIRLSKVASKLQEKKKDLNRSLNVHVAVP